MARSWKEWKRLSWEAIHRAALWRLARNPYKELSSPVARHGEATWSRRPNLHNNSERGGLTETTNQWSWIWLLFGLHTRTFGKANTFQEDWQIWQQWNIWWLVRLKERCSLRAAKNEHTKYWQGYGCKRLIQAKTSPGLKIVWQLRDERHQRLWRSNRLISRGHHHQLIAGQASRIMWI